MGKIIMCGSFKGGVGKTASSWNLAYSLTSMGKKVLAVDFDSQANLTTCFGIEDPGKVPVTIGHLMMNRLEEEELSDPSEYIQSRKGVDFIPSSMMLSAVDSKLRMEFLAGLDSFISSPHQAFCYDFVSDWLYDEDAEALLEIARAVEEECKLPQRFMKLEVSDLVDTEIFPCLDEVMLIKLMTEIGDHIIDVDVIRGTVEKRRTCVNYASFQNYYEGILQVANMQAFYKEHITGFHSAAAKDVWKEYTSEYYQMDTYYRLFHVSYGESLKDYHSELHDLFGSVMEKVEGLYKNWFLGQLGGNWQTVCSEELAKYGRILEVPQQTDFYKNRIDSADSRVFVVISDALRYEVAATLSEQLRRETQADVKLQSVDHHEVRYGGIASA